MSTIYKITIKRDNHPLTKYELSNKLSESKHRRDDIIENF